MVRPYEHKGIQEDDYIHCIHNNTNFIFSCRALSVRTSKNTGVMFLSEVALGKEHTITKNNCSLKKAPAGYDSVVARGSVEPGT